MKKFRHFTITDSLKKTLSDKKTCGLCTISGGQDSILTFFVLLHTQKKNSLQVLYCHHFWQLKNFFSSRFLFQVSYLVNVCYTIILPQTSILNENESRDWRKKNFCRVSQNEHSFVSLTGHTETDTLETNLNNLLRGTSPARVYSSNFLNYQKKAGLFFSSIHLNTCFFSKLKKSRKVSQEFSFQNLKTKKKYFGAKTLKKKRLRQKFLVASTKQSVTKTFKFKSFCQRNSLNASPNEYTKRTTFEYSKQKTNFFNQRNSISVKIRNYQNSPATSLPTQNLVLSNTNKRRLENLKINKSFHFFYSPKSYSFCFSNKFSNMRITVIKPLEKTTRFTVSTLVSFYNLPYLVDITNFSSIFSRNKIRHQIIPFMRSLVHVRVELLITRFFRMLEEEHQDRQKEIQELYFLSKLLKSKYRTKTLFFVEPLPNLKNFGLTVLFVPLLVKTKENLLSFQTVNSNSKLYDFTQIVQQPVVTLNDSLIKHLPQIISGMLGRALSQKLFFDYKNLTLNYYQTLKLYDFF